ncbi:MAG: SMC-Scp complex subunit ScpB, partial [Candidatus Margulisbacteria bacterium]|nr:SMC-Scp complex subunit ScpB [Candidatus Margulisiibacteriota bacterium]
MMEFPVQQLNTIKNILESLLFVARKPLTPEEIAQAMGEGVSAEAITTLLEELLRDYEGKGINIIKVAGGYLMGTSPENADYVYNLL